MTILTSTLPLASTQIAHNGQQATQARAGSNPSQNSVIANALVSGQAVVVSLSSKDSKRVASHGNGRNVDPTFEKQQAQSSVDKKTEENKKKAGGALDVAA